MAHQLGDDVAIAHRMADAADGISVSLFGDALDTARKADGTLVSAADVAVEDELLDILGKHRADDAVVSEERGVSGRYSSRRWILDPIDGTEPFLAGQRSWGTHIALEVDGELQIAIITRPTEQRRWWAVRGAGAWSGPWSRRTEGVTALAVSDARTLTGARIGAFVAPSTEMAAAIARYGRFVIHPLGPIIGLLEGEVDVMIAPGGALWDHAPQILLTTEAGGCYTDRDGGRRCDARGGIYTNGLLDDQVHDTAELRHLDG